MLFLTVNWTNALIVTLLGFSLVFCLLVLLIIILAIFGAVMKPKKVRKEHTLEGVPTTKVSGVLSDEELAVVGLALQMYFDDSCHESGKLTLKSAPTAWNSKIYGINNIDK